MASQHESCQSIRHSAFGFVRARIADSVIWTQTHLAPAGAAHNQPRLALNLAEKGASVGIVGVVPCSEIVVVIGSHVILLCVCIIHEDYRKAMLFVQRS